MVAIYFAAQGAATIEAPQVYPFPTSIESRYGL